MAAELRPPGRRRSALNRAVVRPGVRPGGSEHGLPERAMGGLGAGVKGAGLEAVALKIHPACCKGEVSFGDVVIK